MPAPGQGSSHIAKMPEKYKECDLNIRAAHGTMGLLRDAIIINGTVKAASFHQESALDCPLMARAIEKSNRGFLE